MEYQIQITERLKHLETVSAASETEAVELVRKYYKEEKIVLDSDNLADVDFAVETKDLLQIPDQRFPSCSWRFVSVAE